ncbi:flippase-like domain-containing protein [Ornithinimicrobium sp. Arc0846-15]|nr:flippase-like domain-containing protein [Ornithinimicrobium laminariae]
MTTAQPEPGGSLLDKIGWKEVAQSLVGFAIAIVLLVYGLPWIAGTTWPQIGEQMKMVGVGPALLMAGLLITGLYCYTYTLIATLPGLTHLRALMVNAAGSMVSNILPGGGAVGVAMTYMMFRSWGFSRRNISTAIVVGSIWNLLARLILPIIGALVVVVGAVAAPNALVVAAFVAAGVGIMLVGFFVAVISSERFAADVGSVLKRAVSPLTGRFPSLTNVDTLIADQRARTHLVVSEGWVRLTLGLVGMFGFFFILYVVASRSVGLDLAIAELLAAYTFRQFLTVVAITPGGLGVTEVGTAGILVAFGGDPTAASAAALLYAVFTHLLEVPLGLAAWAGWWFGPRHKTAAGQMDNNLEDPPTASDEATDGPKKSSQANDPLDE